MPDAVRTSSSNSESIAEARTWKRIELPSLTACALAILSAVLLTISFPDFNLWPLAWISLIPLLVAIARRPLAVPSFLIGWLTGSIFFYASCYWLTFSMINYGGLPSLLAYVLLIPGAATLGLFPGIFASLLSLLLRTSRTKTLLLAPFIWIVCEWARLEVTGQLWNAIGYSQAYKPFLIQSARWGGVYAVGFFIVLVNAAIAFAFLNRRRGVFLIGGTAIALAAIIVVVSAASSPATKEQPAVLEVVAIQPSVPMNLFKTDEEMVQLTKRHVEMSENALAQLPHDELPRLIVWPESPMNFSYANDLKFQDFISRFARNNNAALILNSQEPAPNNGIYNSALLINPQGRLIGQYDKIRLLPFGEYVPLPRWLPGANLISGLVGDFSPGSNHALLPVGGAKAGVFICIESAYPSIARTFSREGADVLINISNDGYLGRTAVMRQHLANAVFRAVENGRPLLRVTNTGITAYITARGDVRDQTEPFQPAVRVWTASQNPNGPTIYTRFGDVFVLLCALVVGVVSVVTFVQGRR